MKCKDSENPLDGETKVETRVLHSDDPAVPFHYLEDCTGAQVQLETSLKSQVSSTSFLFLRGLILTDCARHQHEHLSSSCILERSYC